MHKCSENKTKKIRPLKPEEHIHVVEYFHNASNELLEGMGVNPKLLIPKKEWIDKLLEGLESPLEKRSFYYVGWELDLELIGHSNVNNLTFGQECNIHLHMWRSDLRQKGLGQYYFVRSVNHFFEMFELNKIICEPYSENPAPNKTLARLGIQPVRQHYTVPGIICDRQLVTRYEICKPFPIRD